ncbi:MAG: hypothetical protein Kow00117_18370 [Phototrophicales bacterium]
METKTVKIPAIGCNGCVNTIKNEVKELPGVISVEGSVDDKTVTIRWDSPANWEVIQAKLVEIEYEPEL